MQLQRNSILRRPFDVVDHENAARRELKGGSRDLNLVLWDREVRWTVATEAALFFSTPCWWLSTGRVWPSKAPLQFSLAVLTGATAALILCHMAPALYQDAIASFWESPSKVVLRWLAIAWFGIGAMASVMQLARVASSMAVCPQTTMTRRPGTQFAEGVRLTLSTTSTSTLALLLTSFKPSSGSSASLSPPPMYAVRGPTGTAKS